MINHPRDLAAWQRWQRSRGIERIARRVVSRVRGSGAPPDPVLLTRSDNWSTLAVVDAPSPTIARAIIDPALLLGDGVALLCAPDAVALVDGDWNLQSVSWAEVERVAQRATSLLSIGHHLPLSAAVFAAAPRTEAYVVQHGLITPYAPPLPANCTLLAWSDADAEFWKSDRADVDTQVVGSQLFWGLRRADLPPDLRPDLRADLRPDDAGQSSASGPVAQSAPGTDSGPVIDCGTSAPPQQSDAPPVFLGQLHGAELPRRLMARTAASFCLANEATYRPHPAERDKLSLLQHRRWRQRGIAIDTSGAPLAEANAPVVSIFSTGVLEAAARGIPSWVVCDSPPRWLVEFWERYDMRRWGDDATPAPQQPDREPAATIAALLR